MIFPSNRVRTMAAKSGPQSGRRDDQACAQAHYRQPASCAAAYRRGHRTRQPDLPLWLRHHAQDATGGIMRTVCLAFCPVAKARMPPARDRHRAPEICLPDLHRRGDAGRAIEGAIGPGPMAGAPGHLIMGGLPGRGGARPCAGEPGMPITCHYTGKLPLYRKNQILARAGPDLHRAVLADGSGQGRIPSETGGGPAGRASQTLRQAVHRRELAGPSAGPGTGPQRPGLSGRPPAMTDRGVAGIRPAWSALSPRPRGRECRDLPDRL